MDAQRQEAGIIKEREGSKCEDLGSVSVGELTAQNKSRGENVVMEEESKSNQVN